MKDTADNKTIDVFEKKAMTGAERQAKLREKMKGMYRLDCYINKEDFLTLDGMKQDHTLSEFISILINEHYERVYEPLLKIK